jgi:hypothetical protein
MKTLLQRPTQKPTRTNARRTALLNPKTALPALGTLSAWDAFLAQRQGTHVEDLRRLGQKTLRHYAETGCPRAILIQRAFQQFLELAQLQGAHAFLGIRS